MRAIVVDEQISKELRSSWYPLCLFSLSLLLILFILPLTRQGMFMDGVIYAAIAKNLSLGHGSIWQPFYSKTLFPSFFEHPPLVFYFQSMFFKWFGQGFGVEQFYSFLMAFGQFTLIACYWLKQQKANFWTLGLLLFFWLLIPLNHLYLSNMLEATLTLFTTLASLILLLKVKTTLRFCIQYLIASLAMLVAFFCNGPTAFFPLAIPMLRTLQSARLKEALKETMILISLTAILLISFYGLVPDAFINTKHYFSEQLLASVIGDRQLNYVGLNHLKILLLYVRAYWLVSFAALICWFIAAKIEKQSLFQRLRQGCAQKQQCLLFFFLSLVSSLPVGISHRQAFNYIMQSAPFFNLAVLYFCYEEAKLIAAYCRNKPTLFKSLLALSLCTLMISAFFVLTGTSGYNRHQTMLEDLKLIMRDYKQTEMISASPAVYNAYYTGAYLARYSMMSITLEPGRTFYLALKQELLPANYSPVSLPLSYYQLARLNS